MAREIPQVYLITIDGVSDSAIRRAIERTSTQAHFAGWTHFFGDTSLKEVQHTMWHKAFRDAARCSHMLYIQYDGWVLDGSLWKDSWLEYDYIGAPWPWKQEGQNVGNGGFSLRSVRLMKFLAKNSANFPVPKKAPEDAVLCQEYRPLLERMGFRWAPTYEAKAFSFERGPQCPTFGFHGIYNIPKILSPDDWKLWKSNANDYIRSKVEWQEVKDL